MATPQPPEIPQAQDQRREQLPLENLILLVILSLLIIIGATVWIWKVPDSWAPAISTAFLAFIALFTWLLPQPKLLIKQLLQRVRGHSKDFFISYHDTDHDWVEWIAWQLEQTGYTVTLGQWNFQPTSNLVSEMHKATARTKRTIAVLSHDYLEALYRQPEWVNTFRRWTLIGRKVNLLPVRVQQCELEGFLEPIVYIDLFGQTEAEAQRRLIDSIHSRYGEATKEARSLVIGKPRFPGSLPDFWNVPPRNPFFTGREDLLKRLHDTFAVDKSTHILAISALGGMGKTQTAIEYAYRYNRGYQAALWVRADSPETLISGFGTIAVLLDLLEKNEQNQNRVVDAVKSWLNNHDRWLLILDNADNLPIAQKFIPMDGKGRTLLTTREQAMGKIAKRMEVEKMEPVEGALLLLRRANIIAHDGIIEDASEADRAKAQEIAKAVDGLPLALDQAGAYIEETECSLSDYLNLYQTQHAEVLKWHSELTTDYPESVATTWSLSFKNVEDANPAAAELLRFCAFLQPDVIPEEIITEGASDLGPILQPVASAHFKLNIAVGELRRYSLVRRNPNTGTLIIHRLVQAVLKDRLNEDEQRQWAERTVRAVNRAFPEVEFATWNRCQRCLPHAQACAALIKQWNIVIPEAVLLLDRAGDYLRERAQYAEAQLFYQQALVVREQKLGKEEYLDVARSLYNLAVLYYNQSKYAQAELLFQRALDIREPRLGPEHPDVVRTINDLAALYRTQDEFAQAEQLFQHVLAIREKKLGPEHLDVARTLNDWALLYYDQGKFAQAEEHFKRALRIRENKLGPDHPTVAQTLNDLGRLYYDWGKYIQAEEPFERALAIREEKLGPEHPDVARTLNNIGLLSLAQGKYAQAEAYFNKSLAIREKTLGPKHAHIAHNLNNLALLYREQGKYAKAEPLLTRALDIRERTLGLEHPDIARSLNNLAALYREQGKYAQAEPLFQRALAIREKKLGPDHPHLAETLNDLAVLYREQGKYTQAEEDFQRALAIRERSLGPTLPDVAQTLNDLAMLYRDQHDQGKYTQAEEDFQRALSIRKQTLGSEHPSVAITLENYAVLLRKMNRGTEAAKLEAQANEIKAGFAQENPTGSELG